MFDKIITTILSFGTAVFTNIQGVNADFSNGLIEQADQQIVASAQLVNCWTPEFDRILQSGQTIKITYRFEVFTQNGLLPETALSVTHELRYRVLDETYAIFQSETDQTLVVRELENAKMVMSTLKDINFIKIDKLKANTRYHLEISAHLNRITLPGMSEEINLMAYWKGVRPSYRSEPFRKADFSL